MDSTAPAFEAAKGVDQKDLEKVCSFMMPIAEKLKDNKRGVAMFGTDVNGTLDHPVRGPLIDLFLCDMHDRGASVIIISGMDHNDLSSFQIARKLAGGNLAVLRPQAYSAGPESQIPPRHAQPWFHMKPFGIDVIPRVVFDDETFFKTMLQILEGTFIHSKEGNPDLEILEIWSRMSKAQKDIAANILLGDAFKLTSAKPSTTSVSSGAPAQAPAADTFS